MSFAHKEPTVSIRRRGLWGALRQLAEELADVFGYWIGLFALVGVWRLRRRLNRPADRLAHVFLLLYTAAVVYFAAREGYLEARHLLPWLVVGIGCAGYGALATGSALGRWIAGARRFDEEPNAMAGRFIEACIANERRATNGSPDPRALTSELPNIRCAGINKAWSGWAWLTAAVAGACCLVDLVWPLSGSHLGHRQAAEWLADESQVPGSVLDTLGWTGLYSGRETHRYHEALAVLASPNLAYVVVEQCELAYLSRRARTMRELLAAAAERVEVFPRAAGQRADRRIVEVYRWFPERFAGWLATKRRSGERAVQVTATAEGSTTR